MSKKMIIKIAAAGLVSFGGAFILAWFTAKTVPQMPTEELNESTLLGKETALIPPLPRVGVSGVAGADESQMKTAIMKERLKSLVYEVRENIREYDDKQQALELREQRLQRAHSLLKRDIEKLDNLHIQLTLAVDSLKVLQDKLEKSRVKIAGSEKANLMTLAATYDKMDAASAGKILAGMSGFENVNKGVLDTSQMQEDSEGSGNDAVKILYYMTERTRAKLLADLATSQSELAAYFCRRLKQIVEEQ